MGSPVDSINNKALVQSSPSIPSLKVTLTISQSAWSHKISRGMEQHKLPLCSLGYPWVLSYGDLQGLLGARSHTQPATCLHCCPVAPSLLLHPFPERTLLSALCLPLFFARPGRHNFSDEFPARGRRGRESCFALPEALLRRRAAPSLFVSQTRSPGEPRSSGALSTESSLQEYAFVPIRME